MTDNMREPSDPLRGRQAIASPSLLTEAFLDGIYEEIHTSGYVETLLGLPPQQRLAELRHYAELVEAAQQHAWRLAARLVANNATRDKLLHPDLYKPVLYFEPTSLALEDESAVPYFVELSVVPLPNHEDDYDEFRDVIYDLDRPGFCERSELIAAIPGVSIKFKFYEATSTIYSPHEHEGGCYLSLEGKIALRREELDFTISNARPIVSVEMLDTLDERTDEEAYMLAFVDVLVELKLKNGIFAYYSELLEQMQRKHMLYPDLDYVEIGE